jgi:hypothetical protein
VKLASEPSKVFKKDELLRDVWAFARAVASSKRSPSTAKPAVEAGALAYASSGSPLAADVAAQLAGFRVAHPHSSGGPATRPHGAGGRRAIELHISETRAPKGRRC